MTISSISTISTQQTLASYLEAEQVSMTQLTEQLSTGQEYGDLTDYTPSDALNLMNLQNSATQSQAYLGVIDTVQSRLSGYSTTMSDMESIATQAQTLASGNAAYNPSTATSLAAEATSYLKSVSVDLNQQINGRYIYSGSRYGTAPVGDLTSLTSSTLSPAVYTDGATLPVYDTAYAAGSLTMATSGQTITLSGTPTAGQSASATVNGTTYTYAIQAGDTVDSISTSLAALVNAAIPGTTSTNGVITVGNTGTVNAASSNSTSASAYATDQATIDSGDTISYGVSSNSPAFQQLIAGLRYIQAAGSSTDSTTYASDMAQANTLLTSALSGIDTLNTVVAGNTDLLTNETTSQNAAITNFTNQVDNIQSVNVTQVSAEITALQTQIQASYTVTGDIEKMSLAQYL